MLQQDLSADVRAERTELTGVPDVVVADDGGWGSRRALEQAAREAERRRARLVVVTVVVSSPVEPEGWADGTVPNTTPGTTPGPSTRRPSAAFGTDGHG